MRIFRISRPARCVQILPNWETLAASTLPLPILLIRNSNLFSPESNFEEPASTDYIDISLMRERVEYDEVEVYRICILENMKFHAGEK